MCHCVVCSRLYRGPVGYKRPDERNMLLWSVGTSNVSCHLGQGRAMAGAARIDSRPLLFGVTGRQRTVLEFAEAQACRPCPRCQLVPSSAFQASLGRAYYSMRLKGRGATVVCTAAQLHATVDRPSAGQAAWHLVASLLQPPWID
jgi:hypothetical protein